MSKAKILKDKDTQQKSLSIEYYSDFWNCIFTNKHNAPEEKREKEKTQQYKTMGKLNEKQEN